MQKISTPIIDISLIKNMIIKRNEARKNKDYTLSDNIRHELLELGISLEDTKDGTQWKTKF